MALALHGACSLFQNALPGPSGTGTSLEKSLRATGCQGELPAPEHLVLILQKHQLHQHMHVQMPVLRLQ